MTYKISTVQRDTADEFTISDTTATIAGAEYDLENPKSLAVTGQDENGNDILETIQNQRVSLLSEDMAQIYLEHTAEKGLMFQRYYCKALNPPRMVDNLKLFFEMDGIPGFSLDDLKTICTHYNMSADELKTAMTAIKVDFYKASCSDAYTDLMETWVTATSTAKQEAFAVDFEKAFPNNKTAASTFNAEMATIKTAWFTRGRVEE